MIWRDKCRRTAISSHESAKLLEMFNIVPTRLFNLNETGMRPGNDCRGNTEKKVVVPHGANATQTELTWSLISVVYLYFPVLVLLVICVCPCGYLRESVLRTI